MLSYMAGVGWCLFMYKNIQPPVLCAGSQNTTPCKPSNSCIADTIYAQSLNAAMFVVYILCGYIVLSTPSKM